ncbi:MAG TPA: MlaD family protein [Gemmatimonadales bacterium]|nr:MlaD family protein [Gemmatimonadales bacterium]
MDTNRQDFIVGLLIVVTVGLVIGALLATSGWGQRRYALYMRVANAEGINADTRVLVEGLEIGRVASIVPRIDPTNRRVSFIARLSLAQEFDNGSKLLLPLGTKASIASVSQISSASEIVLILPDSTHGAARMLGAGDTINSDRPASALDALKVVVTNLSSDVHQVLVQSREALVGVQHTLAQASATIRDVQPGLLATLASVSASMARIDSVTRRIPPGLADSVTTTLASSNRLLLQLDSLTRDVRTLTSENRGDLRATAANLAEVSRQLNHFADAVSRRPYRFLTGVTPLPPEKALADPPKDSIKP